MTAPPEIWPLVRVMCLAISLGIMLLAVSAFLDLNDSQSRELRHLAHHDRLTGLHNRHFMAEVLPSEIARVNRRRAAALREERPLPCLGFVLVDLDHFKQVNDTWGHSMGDQVLGRVADAIAGAARTSDVAARWGGEEFFVLLRDLQLEGLSDVPARILEAVRGLDVVVEPGRPLPLTCSLGFTHFPCGEVTGADCWELALKLAGLALLAAKQGGRDRGVGYVWGRPPSSRDGAGEALSDVAAAVERGVLRRVEVLPGSPSLPRSTPLSV